MIGIYCIHNKVNNKKYFGQSIDLEGRTSRLERNSHLNSSIKKYGIENFEVYIVEECSEENLDTRESYYIALYDTMNPMKGYNKESGGNLHKRASAETKKRLSESHLGNTSKRGTTVKSEESRNLLGELLRSYQHSDVYRESRSKSMTEAWKSTEYREKMRESQRVPNTLEHNSKISSAMQGNTRNLGKKNVHRFFNGVKESMRIDISEYEDYLSNGWLPGMGPRNATSLPRT